MKPRICRICWSNGQYVWKCRGSTYVGYGHTPATAYKDYIRIIIALAHFASSKDPSNKIM